MKSKKEKEIIIELLKKNPIVEVVCQKAGVSRASFYRWKKEDPEFAKAADEALAEGLLLMNDIAESQLLSAIRDKNLSGIIFWLKHRHEAYGNKIQINGRINRYEELTPEEETVVREALRLASNGTGQKYGQEKPQEQSDDPRTYIRPDDEKQKDTLEHREANP